MNLAEIAQTDVERNFETLCRCAGSDNFSRRSHNVLKYRERKRYTRKEIEHADTKRKLQRNLSSLGIRFR